MESVGHLRQLAAGVLLTAAIAAVVVAAMGSSETRWVGGLACWGAALLLWPAITSRARQQALVLLALGVLGLGWGLWYGVAPDWQQISAANASLIAMLAAVSFLPLVAQAPEGDRLHPPVGRRALLSTLLGVHLFGSVINLSTVFIVAERIRHGGTLDSRQLRLLTRSFGAASLWSPFFAAMAAALTYAPGARLLPLLAVGIPLAAVALWVTYRDLAAADPDTLRGFPMRFASLWLPALLALLVVAVHGVLPDLSILAVISLLSPSLTVAVLMFRRQRPLQTVVEHLRTGLPAMRNELALFLSAGVLAAGLASVFATFGNWSPISSFDGTAASLTLAVMVVLAVLGVHPVIAVAGFGTLLAPIDPDPQLLAMTFLAAWSIGISLSPLSGMNLALQGAYGFKPQAFLRCNFSYALKLLAAAAIAFHCYAWWAVEGG